MDDKDNRTRGRGPKKAFLAMALAAIAGMGQAEALNVLIFESGDADRKSSIGGFGFSMTQVGANHAAGLDFTLFDVIYVSQSYEEFLSGSLFTSLSARAADLAAYMARGGGLVFGSPAIGGGLGGITVPVPGPVTQKVDFSDMGLAPPPSQEGNSTQWASSEVPAVPEPGAFALMGLGLAGILLVRRRARAR